MDDKKITFMDAPQDYALCFNATCALRRQCMHYHIGQLAPAHITRGAAIYPTALENGKCKYFAEIFKVDFAWGFDGIFKNTPKEQIGKVRKALRNHLSRGASTYYRYHHGTKLLSPALQKEILDFMSQYGSTEGLRFDHYVTTYDFT